MADISKVDLRKEIAAILKGADLSATSAKKVRQELEEKLDTKLQSRKKEIDDLVMEFVSAKDKKKKKKDDSEEDEEEEEEEEEDEEEEEEDEDSEEDKKKKKRSSTGKKPVAKKAKKPSEDESGSEHSDDDESEEEYSPKRKSSSKPIKTRKLPPKKKKGSESDSDEDWGKKKAKKGAGGKRGGGGYTKTMTLSPELAALVGSEAMARHEVVKKIWSIIKERDLYDPNNKQFAICDDSLMKVIGVKRFRTFGMMKYLKNHFS